jgi:hypothetical protein
VRRDTDAIVKSLMRRAVETSVLGVKLPPSTAERIRGAASNPTRIMRGIGRRLGFIPPVRPMTQADWHKLTEQYAGECEKYRHHGPGYLEISYEEILADPLSLTNQISRFASISPDDKAIRNAAAFVSIDRK